MKLNKSSLSPFVINILGVGSFFIFMIIYIYSLFPFFYTANYFVFSVVSKKIHKSEKQECFFFKMPDCELKKALFQIKSLKKNHVYDIEEFDQEKVFLYTDTKEQILCLEMIKDISFSELNILERPLDIYYQSYMIYFDKNNNSLLLKDNLSLVYDSLSKPFDNNSIDSVKMKMDKINYDFQLELERWYGRFLQKNRKIISEIIYFINNSKLPEILKKDVASMFGNDLIILDSEDYLRELISVLENIKNESGESLYDNEIIFLRKKYAELYKIKEKIDVNVGNISVYDFFKTNNIFISDNLKIVLKKDILVQGTFSNQLSIEKTKLKEVGDNFLLINKNWDIKLFNDNGELLKVNKYSCGFYILSIFLLISIFCASFFKKEVFALLIILVSLFIFFFANIFFVENILIVLYSIFFRRYRLR